MSCTTNLRHEGSSLATWMATSELRHRSPRPAMQAVGQEISQNVGSLLGHWLRGVGSRDRGPV